jgi:hypothetical protein
MDKIQTLSLSVHTIYSELLERAQMDAFDRDFPPNGTFVERHVKDGKYWYFNLHNSEKGETQSRYAGPDTPELRARIEQHGHQKANYKDRRTLVRTLRQAGLAAPVPLVGDLIEAFSNAGVFRMRACLIGTAAFQTYSAILGVKLTATAAAMTEDLDLAQFFSISTHVEDTTPPLLEIIQSVDKSFTSVPYMAEGRRTRAFRNKDGFRVELLVPNRGREDYEGKPVAMPALGGTDGLALRFLDHLIYQEIDTVILHKAGVLTKVPQPSRFAVHKLIVADRRPRGNPKARKDVEQAEFLIEALDTTRRMFEFEEAWKDAWSRGQHWQDHLRQGIRRLRPEIAELLPADIKKQ